MPSSKEIVVALLGLTFCAANVNADIIISEFMSSNTQTLVDEDGDASDWIELFNAGANDVNLSGWHLTDDEDNLRKWEIPFIELAAGAYTVIYASSKDRTERTGYHTSFNLRRGGEYLGLVHPNGIAKEFEYAPEYPRQENDVSYGVSSSGRIGFLQTPTPNAANSALAVPRVTIEPASTTFTGELLVTLAIASEAASDYVIRYTLDGGTPTINSTIYTGPFTITAGADVLASVFSGSESSRVTSARYIQYDSDLVGFESSLPLVIVDTRKADVSTDSNLYTPSSIAILDIGANGGRASLANELEYAGHAGLRTRGSSATRFPKLSYRLELWNDNQRDIDIDVLELGADSDWLLIAPGFMDRNLIANPFMSDLAGDMGLQSMQWRFVELYLNTDNESVSASDYQGIYLLYENIKVGRERIDIANLSHRDSSEPEIGGGYIFKRDRSDPDEFFLVPDEQFNSEGDLLNRVVVHRPTLNDLNNAQTTWIEDYVRAFESALLGSDPMNESNGYRAYIDERSWIDAHILDVFSLDADLLQVSNNFHKDRGLRIVNGPVWDFDRSLNSADTRDNSPSQLHSIRQVNPFDYSWWGALFSIEHFDKKYRRRWHALRQGPLSVNALFARVDNLSQPLFEPYPRENDRWNNTSDDYGSRYGGNANYQGEIDALKSWIAVRLTALDNYFADPGIAQCADSTLGYPLVRNTWAMLSLPCKPPAGSTLGTIFGDDISGLYGTDWAVFTFDPNRGDSGRYIALSTDDMPSPGQGFWIIQKSEALVVLDLPANSTHSPSVSRIPITAKSRWMMMGNPQASALPIAGMRVVDDTGGTCPAPDGCTLDAAASANILQSPLFTYYREASSGYHPIADVGLLNEWSAFWVFAGAAAGEPGQHLVIPGRVSEER